MASRRFDVFLIKLQTGVIETMPRLVNTSSACKSFTKSLLSVDADKGNALVSHSHKLKKTEGNFFGETILDWKLG